MKIALLTLGTRGDVQPFAVLGKALTERGHEVILVTAKNFLPLAESYGLNFHGLEVDFQELLNSPEGKRMLKANPFAVRRNLSKQIYPMIARSLGEFYKVSAECDRVIYHVKTLSDVFADQFPEKMIRASLVPVVEPTREFANPFLSGIPIPAFLNRASYKLAGLSVKMLSQPVRAFRSRFNLPEKYSQPPVKNIYSVSPSFLPTPRDFPAGSAFRGFWFSNSTGALSQDLEEFFKKGEPPLLITFGSMPFESKMNLEQAIVDLAENFNIRIIVVKGWGIGQAEKLKSLPSVMVVDSAPYDLLMPEVRAVVHHGGIGTTAECLRAGKPFFVCPILYPIGDQQFWGELGFKKGVAVKPVPLKKLHQERFHKSIEELLSNRKLYANAELLAKEIHKEKGLEMAIHEIESI